MNCLLDTATLIWSLMQTDKLSDTARSIIGDTSAVKHVSTVSLLEMSIKMSIGKLTLKGIDLSELPGLLYQRGVVLIVLEPFETITLQKLPHKKNHHDPFDRLLICQAIERNLTLLSPDDKISQYCRQGLSLIW